MADEWRKAARFSEMKEGCPLLVRIGSHELALHLVSGEVYATANICTHAWARLSDGALEEHNVICPMHEGGFDVRTGAAVFAPCLEPLATYRVKLENDAVFVRWPGEVS